MRTRLLHLTVLAGFAFAQPVYDVLRRSGEFFVAHRADAGDIVLLACVVSAAAPCVMALLLWMTTRASARAGTAVMVALVGLLTALIALPPVSHASGLGTTEVLGVCAGHGALAALLYGRYTAARRFVTLLSPSAVIFPLLFLLHPAMRPFVHPAASTGGSAAQVPGDTPVVFVIFDQLPLVSLLAATGEDIDATRFPGFAALAADSTWYRNATTTADSTAWAIPSLLSGRYPSQRRQPTAADYPHNLFTMLGARYRIEAMEPVTHLCPERLCAEAKEPRLIRQMSMLSDLSIVYARIIAPAALAARLPRLTDDWRDFVHGQAWHERWVTARDEDRRVPIARFIEGISREDPQPTLYFAHVLLPHEPYIYLPDGRQFTTARDSVGLDAAGVWPEDPWYALQAYRRHLLQVGYVDALVARLVARLKQQGLYDRALIVVTSDHGVTFTPGQPMKGLRAATVAEVAAVPLFIKAPHQAGREVSDRNVQAIDVLPTVADLLDARLPFETDGASALDDEPAVEKQVYCTATGQTVHLPASVRDLVIDAGHRKAMLFAASGPPDVWTPKAAPFPELWNQPVQDVPIGEPSRLSVELIDPWRFTRADPQDDFVPARVEGRIHDAVPATPVLLAIAIDGVIRTTTKSVSAPLPAAGAWTSVVDPRVFHQGVNVVDVYEIADDRGHVVLRPAVHSASRPPHLNLILGEASGWGVREHGLYGREWLGDRVFRWTNGDAEVTLTEHDYRDAVIRVALAPIAAPGEPMTIAVNTCTLFSGVIATGEWDHSFSLSGCPAGLLKTPDVHITITSARVTPHNGDKRVLGVPILALEFVTAR